MITNIEKMTDVSEWCDYCKQKIAEKRCAILIQTSNKTVYSDMVLCDQCVAIALEERGLIPEDF